MEFVQSIGLFAAKAGIFVLAIIVVLAFIAMLVQKSKKQRGDIHIENVNDRFKAMARAIKLHTHSDKDLKKELKELKKLKKQRQKDTHSHRAFLIRFEGDLQATAVDSLREEITTILTVAKAKDEVIVCVESPGGVVHGYGLAASQLVRLRDHGLTLTVCVDKVAASGGYLMACVANRILCAPFAIVGSIGVLAQVPNLHRLLKQHNIDYLEETAGEFKRTVSFLGEITQGGLQKFREQLEDTHLLFKEFITQYRPQVDIAKVATGEYWPGQRALNLQLIDAVMTSDEYLVQRCSESEILEISYQRKEKWSDKVSQFMGKSLSYAYQNIFLRQWPWMT
jgi:serine protease SohB